MRVGCVKEIKNNEYRVGLTPDNVVSYVNAGHEVYIEKDVGIGSGFTTDAYVKAGAVILDSAKEVWDRSEMMVKVKEPLKEEYLSQSGDIIVRLTAPYTAVLIDETTSGMVVSSNFVVIRVEDKSLLPEYLFWLLNTEKIKRKIYENATSNMLGAVNARFLADFELALLSVEDQRKIAQFNLLAKRERQLLRMLADEKEKYYAGVLNQAYKRAKKGK